VTNTGSDTLSSLVVTDDRGVAVACPQASLARGRDGLHGEWRGGRGPTRMSARCPVSTVRDARDARSVAPIGAVPGIDIEKATNGSDADQPPGPFLPVGAAVTGPTT
jgi:hypothetical protein